MFSRLQQLNLHVHGDSWKATFEKEKQKAVKHIVFCLKLFQLQRTRGAYFLFEHPESADSWQIPELVEFARLEGVMTQVADQCMYGLVSPTGNGKEVLPAKKPTRFMSNSWCVLQELSVRCDKSHIHQPLIAGKASKAQEYLDGLCRAICRGLANQKRYDEGGQISSGRLGIDALALFAKDCDTSAHTGINVG
jgi:hypothetical protein